MTCSPRCDMVIALLSAYHRTEETVFGGKKLLFFCNQNHDMSAHHVTGSEATLHY